MLEIIMQTWRKKPKQLKQLEKGNGYEGQPETIKI